MLLASNDIREHSARRCIPVGSARAPARTAAKRCAGELDGSVVSDAWRPFGSHRGLRPASASLSGDRANRCTRLREGVGSPSDSLWFGRQEALASRQLLRPPTCPRSTRERCRESHRSSPALPVMIRWRTLQTHLVPGVHGHPSGDPGEEVGAGQGAKRRSGFREEAGSVPRSAFHCGSFTAPPLSRLPGRTWVRSGVAATIELPRSKVAQNDTARSPDRAPLGGPSEVVSSIVRPDTWPVSRCGWARREAPWFR